ncbi:CoA transferase subunit A [Nocardia fluminea]|uniref:CoA transferase subunit A n=1 Tax=Nocardia fluminea TaxID=134984 RepID=UPI003D0B192D
MKAMRDKRMTLDEVVGELRSGMTIGIGGWGSRRKPMALVRALLRSDVTDLTVVTYGGPDLGLLCSAGKVRKAYYGFVSLDSAPFYDPWFAKARTEGAITVREMDEGMVKCGLQAAAARLPFLPIRAGLGSSVLDFWEGELKTVASPYPAADGRVETLVAMPALNLDASFVHLDLADKHGNAAYTGVDPYFDDLYCLAAQRRYVSVDRIVETEELVKAVPQQSIILNRMLVDGVVESPGGAHFTFSGSYGRDETFQKHYVAAAKTPESWAEFKARYLDVSEDEYQSAVATFAEEQKL